MPNHDYSRRFEQAVADARAAVAAFEAAMNIDEFASALMAYQSAAAVLAEVAERNLLPMLLAKIEQQRAKRVT